MTAPPTAIATGPVICVPMGVERLALRSVVTPIVSTGIGRDRARRAAAGLGGQARLVAGVGGGLAPQVRVGDVVVATEVLGPDGQRVACPTAPLIAGGLRRLGLTVHLGPVVSTPKLATGADARAELVATGALAVDMESIWLAPASGAGEVPFAVVRVVSDTEDQPLFHPGMVAWGPIALRNLKRCTPVLDAWAAACDAAAGQSREVRYAAHGDTVFVIEHADHEEAEGTVLILAVGSATSSNSRRLVEVAEAGGAPARLVDDATGVDLEWLVNARRIGVTAGASAPASLVDDLVAALAGLGPTTVIEGPAEPEVMHFTLPKEVS